MSREETRVGVAAATTASTAAGRDWLVKALDPINTRSQILGMPTAHSNDIVVLNYVSNYSLGPPPYSGADSTKDSFDFDLLLYQHPLIFGVYACGKQNTVPFTGKTLINVNFSNPDGGANTAIVKLTIPDNVRMWTTTTLTNSQIGGGSSLTDQQATLNNAGQAIRPIYGGAQCIPTCSSMYNQGSFRVTQQLYQSTRSASSNMYSTASVGSVPSSHAFDAGGGLYPTIQGEYFTSADYPTLENCLVNPRSLTCRFSEGLMVPYRLQNPLVNDFQPLDDVTMRSYVDGDTFYVTGIYSRTGPGMGIFNEDTRTFTVTGVDPATGIEFTCRGKDGRPFSVIATFPNGATKSFTTTMTVCPITGTGTTAVAYPFSVDVTTTPATVVYSKIFPPITKIALTNNPHEGWFFNAGSVGEPGPQEAWMNFSCTTLARNMEPRYYSPLLGFRPNSNENVAAVFGRSVSYTAAMQLVIRIGYEVLTTSASTFSTFKQMSPAYDRQALQGYMRASRKMKDGFSGYYSTDEGSAQYLAFLSSLLATVGQEDNALIQFGNQGGTVTTQQKRRR